MQEIDHQAVLASILETAVDAIVLINEVGQIQSVNPATEMMFGYSAAEMVGNNVKMLMPNPFRAEHDQYLERYRESGHAKIIGTGREVVGKKKDGREFPVHLGVSETVVEGRRLYTGIMRDISDWKAAESELRDLNATLDQRVKEQTEELKAAQDALIEKEKFAMLGRISGGIAHEIRNPLNAIKTSVYFLLHANNLSEAKTREHLDRIDRQVAVINGSVSALSDLARLPEPRRDACDINRAVQESFQQSQVSANIEVQYRVEENLPPVWVDEQQMQIVFRNLIRNARDAMRERGGTLTVKIRTESNSVLVTFEDTGIGMDQEVLNRVQEPFFSTKARGMGLGLAISKAILDKNSGKMSVESVPGEGTSFILELPTRCSSG